MSKSIERIRGDTDKNKKICLNVSGDTFRHMVATMFTQLAKDDEYPQMVYSKGVSRNSDKAIEAMLKEYAQMGEGEKKYLYRNMPTNLPGNKRGMHSE